LIKFEAFIDMIKHCLEYLTLVSSQSKLKFGPKQESKKINYCKSFFGYRSLERL